MLYYVISYYDIIGGAERPSRSAMPRAWPPRPLRLPLAAALLWLLPQIAAGQANRVP